MDQRVARLKTPAECEQFIINVQARLPELALAAKRRAVELQAAQYEGATTDVERAAIAAIYAYERVMTAKNGKKTRALRTWKTIQQKGIFAAIEQVVDRDGDAAVFPALTELGMADLAFEAVVVRHAESFSAAAVAKSKARLESWGAADVAAPVDESSTDEAQADESADDDAESSADGESKAGDVQKAALKAFRKRLKVTQLDHDSRIGKSPLTSGSAKIDAITPPNQYPREVWDALVAEGKLKYAGEGMYQLVEG